MDPSLFVGGTITVAGIDWTVDSVSVTKKKEVTVVEQRLMPFVLTDDGSGELSGGGAGGAKGLMQSSDDPGRDLWVAAYVRPAYDVAPEPEAPERRRYHAAGCRQAKVLRGG